MRLLLPLAISVDAAIDLGGGIYALSVGNIAAVPGGFLRCALMVTLFHYAVRKQRTWAIWTFVIVEFVTAGGALVLGAVWAEKHAAAIPPEALAIFGVYSALGVAGIIGRRYQRLAAA